MVTRRVCPSVGGRLARQRRRPGCRMMQLRLQRISGKESGEKESRGYICCSWWGVRRSVGWGQCWGGWGQCWVGGVVLWSTLPSCLPPPASSASRATKFSSVEIDLLSSLFSLPHIEASSFFFFLTIFINWFSGILMLKMPSFIQEEPRLHRTHMSL